jgi:FkbM family methyltransferase
VADHKQTNDALIKKLKAFLIIFKIYTILARMLNHVIKLKSMTVERYGKSFFVSGNFEYFSFWKFKSWEKNTYKIFEKFLDSDHSYIDIGAWIGPTVLFGAQLAKKAYAIEPDPVAFKELKKNVSLNPGLERKIELHEKCINSSSGKVKFGNMVRGGNTTSSLIFADSKTSWIVEGITFNEFVKENTILDCNFIKMDIEGGEAIVLPTMGEYLEKNKPVLYLSIHPPFFKNPVEDITKIFNILKVYKNIYFDSGEKIILDDLLTKNRLIKCYTIVAIDKDIDLHKQ